MTGAVAPGPGQVWQVSRPLDRISPWLTSTHCSQAQGRVKGRWGLAPWLGQAKSHSSFFS